MKNGIQLTSWQALKAGIVSSTKAMLSWLATNPVGWAILAAGAVYGLAKAFTENTTSMEEAKEITEEYVNTLSSINSEVETLEKELKTLNEQIENLNPITDAQDIENLKSESEELENQLAILKEKQRIASNDADNAAQESLSMTQVSRYDFDEKTLYNADPVTGEYITYKTAVEVTRMDELQNAMDVYDKYARKKADLEARMARMAERGNYSQDKWNEYETEIAELGTKMKETRAHASELAIEIDEESKALNGSTEESAELKESTTELLTSYREWTGEINENTSALKENNKASEDVNELFSSFADTEIGQRLQHATKLFDEGKISYKEYFDGLQTEIENVDFSHYTDSLEDAQNAAGQLFVDSTQQVAQGLTNLVNSFNSNEISATEYLDSYLSIARTLDTLTDELQENSEAWDKNGEALSNSENMNLDSVQSDLNSAIETIESYQDSIYGLEQILSGKLEIGTDEFTAQTNVIADDLANIVSSGGEMAEEIKNYMGTSANEIAQSLTDDVSNFDIAAQAIAANTNTAIQNMATSIGELFEELGDAISNFKVDLTFGISSLTMQDVDMGILGTHQLPAITFSLEASGDSLSSIGSAISNFGKNFSENMGQYIEYPDFTIKPEDGDYSPGDDILDNYNKQLDKLKDASGDAGKDAAEEYKEALEKELSDLDTVLGFITDTIQDQIDAWNDAKDSAVDALEAQRDAAIEALEAEKELVQAQIDALQDRIDAKQKEIDAIQDARKEREAEINLQKEQYNLERLQNQQTNLIYKDGQMVYEKDESGIRDARESVNEAKENLKIIGIEKEISVLENEIDGLEDIIDSIDKKIDSVNDHYDKLIEQTEKYYEDLIKGMEEYKSRWEEISEIEEQAKINVLLQELGITTDDVLNMSGEAFEQFKQRYLAILTEMYNGESEMVSAINDVANGVNTDKLSEGLDKTKKNIDKLTETDYSTVVNGVSGISNALNDIPSSEKYDALTNSFNLLADAIERMASALGITGDESVSSLVTALDSLSKISLGDAETGVIAQFNKLRTAIDEVSSAINGDGSKANEGGGLATGANGGAATPTTGGGGSGLTSAITEIGTTTNNTLGSGSESSGKEGSESESGGEGVLGKFSEFKSAVDDVIKIIGTDDEEGSKNSETLISALRTHHEVASDTVPKVTELFDALLKKIEACVDKLKGLSEGISSLDHNMMGTVPITHAKGTVGKAFAKGYNGLPNNEKNALRSEYGQPELTVYPDGTTELTTKPTMSDLPKDTVIFNEEQTRRIMNGKGTVLGKAFVNGTVLNPATTIQGIDIKSLQDKFLGKLDNIILPMNSIDKNVESMVRMGNNIHTNNASQDINISIGDIQLHGVQDVNGLANAISTKLPNMLLQTITKRS